MAHKDIIAPRAGSAPRSRKVSQSAPMMQQRPDLGGSSTQQTLVRLIGSHDSRAQKTTARTEQSPLRSRPRH